MNKDKLKYILTDEIIKYNGHILHRIKALKSFCAIEKGSIGGWIESENNLSQKGNCFVYDNSKVYDNARVQDNAMIFDNAEVYENAKICDNSKVSQNAKVHGNSHLYFCTNIGENTEICVCK